VLSRPDHGHRQVRNAFCVAKKRGKRQAPTRTQSQRGSADARFVVLARSTSFCPTARSAGGLGLFFLLVVVCICFKGLSLWHIRVANSASTSTLLEVLNVYKIPRFYMVFDWLGGAFNVPKDLRNVDLLTRRRTFRFTTSFMLSLFGRKKMHTQQAINCLGDGKRKEKWLRHSFLARTSHSIRKQPPACSFGPGPGPWSSQSASKR
jgi:hypothetical protein